MEIRENGPWFVDQWRSGRIVIQSHDFHFDAALEVSGNFGDSETRRAYAEEICRRLNAMNPLPNTADDRREACGRLASSALPTERNRRD
jgi:hypothetical protein